MASYIYTIIKMGSDFKHDLSNSCLNGPYWQGALLYLFPYWSYLMEQEWKLGRSQEKTESLPSN